jgi:hypothetical protein
MSLDEAIAIQEALTPVAKAVSVLGDPVEGSLKALSKILEFAQVRRLLAIRCGPPWLNLDTGSQVEQRPDSGARRSSRSMPENSRQLAGQDESLRDGGLAAQHGRHS